MEILLIAGAAALIGAYASSRHSRDRELARLEKKARRDARSASKKGDAQACAYYQQVARDFAVQRLSEAEQRAVNEAYHHLVAGRTAKAEKKRRLAEEIRQRLIAEYHVNTQAGPQHSLPIAAPQTEDQLPAIQPYAPYTPTLHAAYTQQREQVQVSGAQQGIGTGPVLYTSLTPSSRAAPSSNVLYFNQQGQDMSPYPSIPPPAYTPPAIPSISSAPTLPAQSYSPITKTR